METVVFTDYCAKKKKGPRIEPCGTLFHFGLFGMHSALYFHNTVSFLHVILTCKQLKPVLLIDIYILHFDRVKKGHQVTWEKWVHLAKSDRRGREDSKVLVGPEDLQ